MLRNIAYTCLALLLVLTAQGAEAPQVKEGFLDLREWDFEKDGAISLKGEWEFYWEQFISPTGKPHQNPDYIKVPSSWNQHKLNNGSSVSGLGYGSYRAVVLLPGKTPHYALKTLTAGTAFTLYFNGEVVAQTGQPGRTKEETSPDFRPAVTDIRLDTNRLEIVIHTSNFDYNKGGVWKAIKIGPEDTVRRRHERELFLDYFLLGGFFIIGLYHLGIFLLRRSDKSNLYYAVGSILVGLRISATGEYIIGYLPWVPWHNIIRLELLSFFLAIGVLALFINAVFNREFHRKVLLVIVIFSGLVNVFTLFAPPLLFSYLVNPYQVFALLVIIYCIYVVSVAVWKKRTGSVLFAIGFFILCLFILHDILASINLLDGLQLSGLGFFIFMLLQSFALAANFNTTYRVNAKLKEQLQVANKSLEDKVELRTEELAIASSTKDKFFGIISHDLRGPIVSAQSALNFIKDDIEDATKDELREDIALVSKTLFSVHALLEDLLIWSRSKQGNIKLDKHHLTVDQLMTKNIDLIEENLKQKNIEIINKLNPKHEVFIDLNSMSTVLRNLISNAIKFTPSKGKITVASKDLGDFVEIHVSDSGVGIPKNKIATLFEITKNKSTKGTNGEQGSGMGLILCKEFVEINNGEIAVKSEQGQGSTFIISLPTKSYPS